MSSEIAGAIHSVYGLDYPGFILGQCLDYDDTVDSFLIFDVPVQSTDLWLGLDGAETRLGLVSALVQATPLPFVTVTVTPTGLLADTQVAAVTHRPPLTETYTPNISEEVGYTTHHSWDSGNFIGRAIVVSPIDATAARLKQLGTQLQAEFSFIGVVSILIFDSTEAAEIQQGGFDAIDANSIYYFSHWKGHYFRGPNGHFLRIYSYDATTETLSADETTFP